MIKRKLIIMKLKEDKIEKYKYMHDNIWPELLEEHKENGTVEISTFLDGTTLYIYLKLNEEVASKLTPDKLPVRQQWQKEMKEIFDSSVDSLEVKEVFHME